MRPRPWARRGRKSDPQGLRIDQDDKRVCVRIVPQSRPYAECFGWADLRPKHPGYITDPGADMSGLWVDSTRAVFDRLTDAEVMNPWGDRQGAHDQRAWRPARQTGMSAPRSS